MALRDRVGVELHSVEAANVAFHMSNVEVCVVGIDSMRIVEVTLDHHDHPSRQLGAGEPR